MHTFSCFSRVYKHAKEYQRTYWPRDNKNPIKIFCDAKNAAAMISITGWRMCEEYIPNQYYTHQLVQENMVFLPIFF